MNTPLSPFLEKFLHYLQYEKQFSPHTIENYNIDLVKIIRFFDSLAIHDWNNVEEGHIRAWLSLQRSQKISTRTLNRQLAALRSFYRYLIKEGELVDNKAQRIISLKSSASLPKALDVDQMSTLLDFDAKTNLEIRDIAILELLYSSGLRVSEIASLNIEDIDLSSRQLTVTGKGKKMRVALIGSHAAIALTKWLELRKVMTDPNEKSVFLNKEGQRLSVRSIQNRLYQFGLKQGIAVRVHPHQIRHSFASHLLESSNDLRAVQELLGHSNLSTTQIYTKVNFQHLANVYDECHPRAKKQKKGEDE